LCSLSLEIVRVAEIKAERRVRGTHLASLLVGVGGHPIERVVV
jgi:hypothetical protein